MVESLTSLCAIALVLAVVDGHPTTTSLDIARHFGKRHDNVIRMIQNLLSQLPAEHALNFEEMFIEVAIGQGGTRKDPAYRLTRDGFTLLAMGFTGKKALQFKLAYIDAFNRMEAELSSNPCQLPPKPKAMLVSLDEPSIDVRALMLSGQGEPVPYPAEIDLAIDMQAWAMARETYELSREHLRRRVAYRHIYGHPVKKIDTKAALVDIKSMTLGHALAHTALSEMRYALDGAHLAAVAAQNAAQRIKKQMAQLTQQHTNPKAKESA